MLPAVIFDLDGLMVDSEPLARQAWERVAARYGHRLDDALYQRMVGRRLEDSSRIVREALQLSLPAAELARQKEEAWAEIRAAGLPPMPGLMELHEEIARRGLPWGVATSSRRAYALEVLAQLGLAESCGAVAGGDEVAAGKPAPDLYLLAAKRLGVPPQSCLALEDSVPGAQAAAAAGMIVVAIPNGYAAPNDFPFAQAVLSSLHEARELLDRLCSKPYIHIAK